MTRGFLALIVAVSMAGSASAHDFWIEPSTFLPEVPASVTLALRVGENFSGRGVRRNAEAIARFVALGPTGLTAVPGLDGRDPAGFLRIDTPGAYVVGYETRGQAIELEAGLFEGYLEEEGLEHVIEARRASGHSDKPGREVFFRCAKTLLRAGEESEAGETAESRPLGLTLELLLEAGAGPPAQERGSTIRLLFGGQPVENALVVGIRRGQAAEAVALRTDTEGRVDLGLSAGEWLVKAVHMVAADELPNADWKSYWASVTFSIAP